MFISRQLEPQRMGELMNSLGEIQIALKINSVTDLMKALGVIFKSGKYSFENESFDSYEDAIAKAYQARQVGDAQKLVRDKERALSDIEFFKKSEAGQLSYKAVLDRYLLADIGMNLAAPDKLVKVNLLDAQIDHFSVCHENLISRIPYGQIIRVTEPKLGAVISTGLFAREFQLIVEVFHLVVYKGAVGFSWGSE